ncbi:hypothetical protein [Actinomadura rugatobispora]|uniref:ABC transporter permease n=1 Tax=Actinomadura rugatobispora TaxID=1994 RepID=A0ABW1AHQ6_9ACTN|nr:hypothetical protein GCM10010200_067900 [Actinomadura rugatobispora]
MIALARFQVAGYVRSLRVLQPLVVVLLLLSLVILQGSADDAELAVGTLGDVAAFLFPVWAWTARALLNTQPDEQRCLSALAVRAHRVRATDRTRGATDTAAGADGRAGGIRSRLMAAHSRALAGLIAAYVVNAGIAVLVLVVPVVQAYLAGVGSGAVLNGLGLCLLVALAATVLGAWTSRAIITDPGFSLLALLGGVVAALLLSLSPLSWVAVPMVDWLRAAHDGPAAFTGAFPAIALHLALWILVVGTSYLVASRNRP